MSELFNIEETKPLLLVQLRRRYDELEREHRDRDSSNQEQLNELYHAGKALRAEEARIAKEGK